MVVESRAWSDSDALHVTRAIELSSRAVVDRRYTPFGAVVVLGGREIASASSAVIHGHDATAHAEVLAIRAAGQALGEHLLPGATMYASGEPCPMCLVACRWAQIGRIVVAATVADSAAVGFEDAQFYRELGGADASAWVEFAPASFRASAVRILNEWSEAGRGTQSDAIDA